MNSKIRIFSLMLAVMMLFSVLLVGCSSGDGAKKDNDDNSKTINVPRPQPIEKITLKALQASVPEESPITKHSLEFQIPETLDTSYEAEDYFNYRVKYSLDDYKMADAAIDKKLDEIYEGASNIMFVHSGDEVFQISDTEWGIIKTVKVNAFTKDGVVKEELKFVLTGTDE